MNKINYHNLLLVAIDAVLKASEKILEVYKTDFSFMLKTDASPVTIADKQANDIICEILKPTGIDILSEEGQHSSWNERKGLKYLWIVDPLDGTKEFIKKNDEFTVNIALVCEGNPVLGVVYCPVLKELYYGLPLDEGSFKALIPDQLNLTSDTVESMLKSAQKLPMILDKQHLNVVVSRSHFNSETEKYISGLKNVHSDIRYVSRGSSLKLCMIAEGTADIYPRFGPTHEWDTAAGHAIILGTKGNVYQDNTKIPLQYNKENTLNPWFTAVNSMYNS